MGSPASARSLVAFGATVRQDQIAHSAGQQEDAHAKSDRATRGQADPVEVHDAAEMTRALRDVIIASFALGDPATVENAVRVHG